MLFPAVDRKFNQVVSAKFGVSDVILILQEVKNGDCLMLEACAEPFCQFRGLADPLARPHQIGDTLYPVVGGAEVCIGAERHVIEKVGTSICTDVPILHKAADELVSLSI